MAKGWMDAIIDKILDDEWGGKHGETSEVDLIIYNTEGYLCFLEQELFRLDIWG